MMQTWLSSHRASRWNLLFVKPSASVLSASARVPMPSHMSLPLPSFMSWAHSIKRQRTICSCDKASSISRYFKSSVSMSRKWQAPLCTHLRRQHRLRRCTCGTSQQLVSGWSPQSEFGGKAKGEFEFMLLLLVSQWSQSSRNLLGRTLQHHVSCHF